MSTFLLARHVEPDEPERFGYSTVERWALVGLDRTVEFEGAELAEVAQLP